MSKTDAHAKFDQAKASTFADTLLTALNHGALCLMVSIGHRTGLFDVMRTLPPSTSEDIARAAGLHERYVREWLGAMVTGRVVLLTTWLCLLPIRGLGEIVADGAEGHGTVLLL